MNVINKKHKTFSLKLEKINSNFVIFNIKSLVKFEYLPNSFYLTLSASYLGEPLSETGLLLFRSNLSCFQPFSSKIREYFTKFILHIEVLRF